MKKNLIPVLIMSLLLLTGCKKFLEQLPDQRTVLDSPEKVSELLVSAYPQGSYIDVCESMSDNVVENPFATTVDAINTDSYMWKDVQSVQQDAPTYYWNSCYAAIAAANQALDAIAKAADQQAYVSQKGEALLCRAYAHFMLVSLFAKTYDPATAATDPGIPYVLSPETVVFGNYERKTVDYTYNMVEKDLQAGLPLIDNNAYAVLRYHFNKTAAFAFAARYYLFKQQYDSVISYAKKAFPSENYAANMRPWLTAYAALSSTETGLTYTKSSENANLLINEASSWWARRFTAQKYSTSSDIINKVLSRGGYANVTGGQTAYNYWYNSTSQIYYIRKFAEHFVRTSLNATTGTGYVMIPLLTTEEVLMNRAEAYVMKGEYDNAIKDLNTFYAQRIKSYSSTTNGITAAKATTFYNTTDTKEALLKTILDAKRAEFLHEGLRWFDILRHKLPVVHQTGTTPNVVTLTLAPSDPRRVLQVPIDAQVIGKNPR
jgi:hypothetical protein